MVYVIKETFNISLYDVTKLTKLKIETEICDRLFGTPSWSISLANSQEILLVNGLEDPGASQLNQLVFQSRDA